MTEQTIRNMAKEFAGAYYESVNRSDDFRDGTMKVKAYKTQRVKVGEQWIERDVEFMIPFRVAFPNADAYVAAAWPHWVEYAREKLSEMLGMTDGRVAPIMKERIFDALIDDRERQLRQGARRLRQVKGDDQTTRGVRGMLAKTLGDKRHVH